ncbi:ABC transporter permease [Dichotomicrobium thermohalophilum]|nr:FtsX-like permease family protein [Dichotomicrobium thermohalophilum]
MPLSVRLALRELRGGLSGFYVFILCIALGVTAIATVGTVTGALQDSIARQGQIILGGDVAASVVHRRANEQERAVFARFGTVSEVGTMRAMGLRPDGDAQVLIGVKAVDKAYPLYGNFELEGDRSLREALAEPNTAVVEQGLLDRLDLEVGDKVKLGESLLEITGVIALEPDRLSGGAAFGPRLLTTIPTLQGTGLLAPGTLIDWRYRVAFPASADEERIAAFREAIDTELENSGFEVRDRTDPSPQITRAVNRLSSFLTLVGLAALLIGGIGVANAISAFVARKRKSAAIYKAIGASTGLTLTSFALQVLMVAALGIVVGLIAGSLIPIVLDRAFADLLPIQIDLSLQPGALVLAAAYGLLTALAFILWPLGRAGQIRPAELLREEITEQKSWPPRAFITGSVMSALALAGLAIWLSEVRLIAAITVVGIGVVFAIFLGVGRLIRGLAARTPRPRQPEMALALANIGGPAGLTITLALSLGAGLALLTMIALTDTSLRGELQTDLPENAPSQFFLGIPKERFSDFSRIIADNAPSAELNTAPMLRGRITAIDGTPTSEIDAPQDAQWVLDGDRGITYSEKLPEHSEVVAGEWWGPDHEGEPLVSFEDELARQLGIEVGDTLTVNVLGREITARVANLRTVAWERLSINFVMIFSPNALENAPYRVLATLNWPEGRNAEAENAALRAITANFPTVTAVTVRDVLQSVGRVLEQVMTAIRVAASLTLIAGVIVLAGAFATVQRRRVYEAVVLKVLGAQRRNIVMAHILEYVLMAVAVAVFAAGLGAAGAWLLVTFVLGVDFTFSALALVQAGVLAVLLMVIFGSIGTLQVLGAKAAPYLRSE